ncbi:MAG: hypothetical protein QOG68_1163, partial [Solirubrobacteraceae bacterium]|nr:hypothetical protein [Solirubrobacteraceae bacterium]
AGISVEAPVRGARVLLITRVG